MARRFVAVWLLFVLLGTGTAFAVEPTNYGHTGGYAGINGGWAIDNSDSDVGPLTDSSGSASAWLGYRIDQLVGIEIQGEWNHGLRKIDGWNITGNMNWYPLQWWMEGFFFQPFFVTGAGVMLGKLPGDSTDLNGAFRLGVGMDLYVHEHWSIRTKGEWVTGVGDLDDVEYFPITLGVQYSW